MAPPTAAELTARSPRRLLFYARPEQHAARNMYELGLLALDRALAAGAFAGWELHGIGTVEGGRRIALGGGASMDLLPRSPQAGYADVLRAHDVGLALMYTPHPSLVPIEMASAGMVCVTNSFENKTAAAMAAISPNLYRGRRGDRSGGRPPCAPPPRPRTTWTGGWRAAAWTGRATGARRSPPSSRSCWPDGPGSVALAGRLALRRVLGRDR